MTFTDRAPRLGSIVLCPYSRMNTRSSRGGKSKRRRVRSVQRELRFERTWGGRRDGAGRKVAKRRQGVPHRVRPQHKARHPVHVTLRGIKRLPSLRKQIVFSEMRRALAHASRAWFRLLHFSVQADHVHLLVEARRSRPLARNGWAHDSLGAFNQPAARATGSGLGRPVPRTLTADAARSASRDRVRAEQLDEAPATRRWARPLQFCFLVRRLEIAAFFWATGLGRRSGACRYASHLARQDRVATFRLGISTRAPKEPLTSR
jgi:hypothetical protein